MIVDFQITSRRGSCSRKTRTLGEAGERILSGNVGLLLKDR